MSFPIGKVISAITWFSVGVAVGLTTSVLKLYIYSAYTEFGVFIDRAIIIGCCSGAFKLTVTPSTSIRYKSFAVGIITQMFNTVLTEMVKPYISSLYMWYAVCGAIGIINGFLTFIHITWRIIIDSDIESDIDSE